MLVAQPPGIAASNPLANQNPTSLTFQLAPSIAIPSSGKIQVLLPSQFLLSTAIAGLFSFFFYFSPCILRLRRS